MRLITSLLLIIPLALMASDYPVAHPGDELYRKDKAGKVISWPHIGGVTRVRLPEPMTLDEMVDALDKEGIRIEMQNMQAMAQDGRDRLTFWLPVVFVSIALTLFLRSYGLQAVGILGFVWASSYCISGIVEIKMAEKWNLSTTVIAGAAVLGVIAFGVLAVALRKKGLGSPGVIGAWLDAKMKKDDERCQD